GALEVDVVDLVALALGGDVEHHPDAVRHQSDDGQFTGTDERDRPEPHRPGGGGRKGRHDVLGGGEQDGDEVLLAQLVPVEDLTEQDHHPLGDGLGRVVVDGGCAADGSHG